MASSSLWKMSSSRRAVWLGLRWDVGPGSRWPAKGTTERVTATFLVQVAELTMATTVAGPSRR